MAIVVPTVLAATPDEYAKMLDRAESLSHRVHVDVSDGNFTEGQTITLAQVHVGPDTDLDLHLMMEDPSAQLETALSLKPSLIIFHAEAEGDLLALIPKVRELGVKAGVAILPETEVTAAAPLIEKCDHVLIFTGRLGYNGGDFEEDQLQRVGMIRGIKPDIEISVDGGVDDENASLIALQGVDVLYAGSYLQKAKNPAEAFETISKQAGVQA